MILEMDALQEIIKTLLFTTFVRDAVPVSAILVAPSGTAKSTLIRAVAAPFIHSTDSFSSQGLWELVIRDSKNELRFITVPDINPTLSRKQSTVQLCIANLLSLTFDGTLRVDDGRGEKQCKHVPMGFISAVTPEIYRTQAKRWFALGLRRRIIPLFYGYSYETQQKLQTMVSDGKIKSRENGVLTLEAIPERLPALDQVMSLHIRAISEKFSVLLGKQVITIKQKEFAKKKWYNENIVPISPHLTLRTLAQAHAITRNCPKVEQEDIDFLGRFLSFCDPEFPKAI